MAYSVKEIIDQIQSLLNTNFDVKCNKNIRYNETNKTLADIKKANDLLKWQPKFSLKDGLKKYIDSLKM